MREVVKERAPDCVRKYLDSTPTASFEDLKSHCLQSMTETFLKEQSGLCAFCCNRLNDPIFTRSGRIAHVSPRNLGRIPETEWTNMVLSCDTTGLADPSCDVSQGARELPLSPFSANIQDLFKYSPSGQMTRKNEAANEMIDILNLDSPDKNDRDHRLRAARRNAITVMAGLKLKMTPAKWSNMLRGNYQPLPPFQPAIADVLGY